MTRLLLLRHGETSLGGDRYLGCGQDPGLSPVGEAQARCAGDRLGRLRPAAVVASPLRRALETAAIALPGWRPEVDPRWAELDFGVLGGLTWAEAEARHPAVTAAWRRDRVPSPPGGEAPAALRDRVAAAIDDLVAAHPGEDVIVVSHGGPVRIAVAMARGLHLDQAWRVRVPLGGIRVVRR